MKKLIIITLVIILVVLFGILKVYQELTQPISDSMVENEVVIPMGSGCEKISEILKEQNLIKSKLAFKVYVKINKISNFQAGTYYLKESMSLKDITEMLQTGVMFDPNQITITYIEGKPIWWLAENIANKTNNSKEDVFAVLENKEYINTLIAKYWFLTDEIKNKDSLIRTRGTA